MDRFGLDKILQQAPEFKLKVMRLAANQSKNHFILSFSSGGFTDNALQRWEPRKNNKGRQGAGVLIKTGNLKNSIRVKSVNQQFATIGTNVPYADIHNRGGRGLAWGKHRFTMPKRQFIGTSTQLNKNIVLMLKRQYSKLLKK